MKPIYNYIIILGFLYTFISIACNKTSDEPSITPLTKEEKARIKDVLIADTSLIKYCGVEILSAKHVSIYEKCITLRLFPDQPLLANGIRSEVTVNYPYKEHDVVVYEWEMLLPKWFNCDEENRWWLMGQWHDQPDKSKGETWDNYPSDNPPIYMCFMCIDEKFYLSPNYPDKESFLKNFVYIEPEKWIKLKFEIKWSRESDGYMKLFVNNEQEPYTTFTGHNMNNAYYHYLQLGMYRDPDIQTKNILSIKAVNVYSIE